ncbi:MAG: hypothetical protein QOD06_3334 [Candidatus Binatota bacterium]|nr:hypothetical protein [Candidatus Binatota bacterium]
MGTLTAVEPEQREARRTTADDRISRALAETGPLCDDCLADVARVRPRQQANKRARALVPRGVLWRERRVCPRCHVVRIVSSLARRTTARLPLGRGSVRGAGDWFSDEGLRQRLVEHLEAHSYVVARDGPSPRRIDARDSDGRRLRVFVRGHGGEESARRDFAEVLLDVLVSRTAAPGVDLAIALPRGFAAYRGLSTRLRWLAQAAPFQFLWVDATGGVVAE